MMETGRRLSPGKYIAAEASEHPLPVCLGGMRL